MYAIASRAGRWPLALALVVVAACSDEPSAPTLSAPARPNAAAGDVFLVTNGSATATAQTFEAEPWVAPASAS